MPIAAFLALALLVATPSGAATIDVADGHVVILENDVCSLREAIVNANAGNQTHDDCTAGDAGADTIRLALNSTYEIPNADNPNNGLPVITTEMTIEGNGSTLTRDSAERFRILEIAASGNLTLTRATVSNGSPGGQDEGEGGGGVRNAGVFTLADGTLTNNFDEFVGGGGLFNAGTATLTNCTVSENRTGGYSGGGIFNGEFGTPPTQVLSMTNCTISGNTYGDPLGGGVLCGGGLYNRAQATLTNCTVTANASFGSNGAIGPCGGIAQEVIGASLTLVRTIVAGNLPILGGRGLEIADLTINAQGVIISERSLFGHAGLTALLAFGEGDTPFVPSPSDINATSDGENIPLDQILNTTLALNAPGTTATHALPIGSRAIDYGTDCPPPATDQRGVPRAIDGDDVVGAACDIGAYELSLCGDGFIDIVSGEECDDGDTSEDLFCRADCTLQCGDGELDPNEQCDDGNNEDGDGCSPICAIVAPPGAADADETNGPEAPALPDEDEASPLAPN